MSNIAFWFLRIVVCIGFVLNRALPLRAAEDRAILQVLKKQNELGLDVVTDGEMRRGSWLTDMAEAVDGFAVECAATLGDVLLRRVPVALGACWSPACSREATARIGAAMGWNDAQSAAQLEAFEIERSTFLRKPTAMDRWLRPLPTDTAGRT